MMEQSDIHILGAGSIGQLIACHLAKAGLDPVLVVRQPGICGRQDFCLVEEEITRNFSIRVKSLEQSFRARVVLVCVKAWQLRQALDDIRPHLDEHSEVVLLQNGMGHQQSASEQLPGTGIISGSVTHGAWLSAERQVVHAGHGTIMLGYRDNRLNGNFPPWFGQFENTALSVHWSGNIDRVLWRKLAINAVVNPLTLLHQCKNGELLDQPEVEKQFGHLCREADRLLARLDYRWRESIETGAREVLRITAGNWSSMVQDYRAGKPTELDYINGYLLAEAGRQGLELPNHEQLHRRARQMLADSGAREAAKPAAGQGAFSSHFRK